MHCNVCSLSPVPSWGPGVTLASVHHRPQPRSRPSFVAAPSRASSLAELPSRDRAAANSSRAAEPGGGECSVPGRGGSTCSSWNIWLPSTEIQSKIWNEYCNSCIWGHSSRGQTGVLSMNLAIIPSLSWCLDPATSRHTRHTRPARDAWHSRHIAVGAVHFPLFVTEGIIKMKMILSIMFVCLERTYYVLGSIKL